MVSIRTHCDDHGLLFAESLEHHLASSFHHKPTPSKAEICFVIEFDKLIPQRYYLVAQPTITEQKCLPTKYGAGVLDSAQQVVRP